MLKTKQFLGTFFILLSTIAYGIMPILSKLAYNEGMTSFNLLFSRFFIAAIMLWSYILLKKLPFKGNKNLIIYILFLSLIGYVGASSMLYMAYSYISPSLATIIVFIHPILIALYEVFILRFKINKIKIFSLILAILGLTLVVWPQQGVYVNTLGIILSLIAAIFYAYYAIALGDKRTSALPTVVVMTYVISTAAIANFIMCLITDTPLIPPNGNAFLYVIILSIFCTVFSAITFYGGLKLIGPGTATIISTFEPVVTCITGFIVMGEVLTSNMIFGGTLILLVILVLQRV